MGNGSTIRRSGAAPQFRIFAVAGVGNLAPARLESVFLKNQARWTGALTAHALAGEREKCMAAGMDDYVAKPVRANDFYAALARWITGIAAASEAPPVVDKTPASTDDAIDPAALDNLQKIRRPGGPDLLARVRIISA